mmetsp:Transcript_39367/g.93298  ORF Transcript_39367/g.93298 Transcript_39367/m.93298 type:complete len:252 (+) Transcript_39367:322-1077(+)
MGNAAATASVSSRATAVLRMRTPATRQRPPPQAVAAGLPRRREQTLEPTRALPLAKSWTPAEAGMTASLDNVRSALGWLRTGRPAAQKRRATRGAATIRWEAASAGRLERPGRGTTRQASIAARHRRALWASVYLRRLGIAGRPWEQRPGPARAGNPLPQETSPTTSSQPSPAVRRCGSGSPRGRGTPPAEQAMTPSIRLLAGANDPPPTEESCTTRDLPPPTPWGSLRGVEREKHRRRALRGRGEAAHRL